MSTSLVKRGHARRENERGQPLGGSLISVQAQDGTLLFANRFAVNPQDPAALALVTHFSRVADALKSERAIIPEPFAEAIPPGHGARRVRLDCDVDLGGAVVRFARTGSPACVQLCVLSDDFRVTVVTGSLAPDVAPVRCDLLIVDASYGLPVYRWPSTDAVCDSLRVWLQLNADAGRPAVLAAEPTDEAQRVLQLLPGRAFVHQAIAPFAPSAPKLEGTSKRELAGHLVLVPPSALVGDELQKRLGPHETAFASGRMRVRGNRRRLAVDRGFVISSRADWPTLLRMAEESGAHRIRTFGAHAEPLARALLDRGFDARPLDRVRP
jgi:hypothetical protein